MSFVSILLRGLPCLSLALMVSACTHDSVGDAGASLEDSVQPRARLMALAPDGTPSRRGTVAAATHPRMVSLPAEAGNTGVVRSRDYADGFRQDIALAGAKVPLVSNGMTVLVRSDARETLEERVPLAKPSEGAIRSEIGAAMPHVAMQVVGRERSNLYGPYGLALGRVGADTRCLYMWQWIDSNRLPTEAGLAGPVSVRVRLCRAGTSFDAMADWTDHLIVGAQDGPVAVADEARVLPIVDAPEAAPSKRGAHHGRRRLAEHRRPRHVSVARGEEQAPTVLAAPASAPDGPRYLTDATVPATAVRAQPVVSAAPVGASKFGGDLPPEAFAGPNASPSSRP